MQSSSSGDSVQLQSRSEMVKWQQFAMSWLINRTVGTAFGQIVECFEAKRSLKNLQMGRANDEHKTRESMVM